MRLVYGRGHGEASTRNLPTSKTDRERYCLADGEVLELADYAIRIEDHYSKLAGQPTPMDVEWAKDGEDGRLPPRNGSIRDLYLEGQRPGPGNRPDGR